MKTLGTVIGNLIHFVGVITGALSVLLMLGFILAFIADTFFHTGITWRTIISSSFTYLIVGLIWGYYYG